MHLYCINILPQDRFIHFVYNYLYEKCKINLYVNNIHEYSNMTNKVFTRKFNVRVQYFQATMYKNTV